MTGEDNCPFCKIVSGEAPAKIVATWAESMAIVPLNPVVMGHVLVIPKVHVRHALTSPLVTGYVMQRAASIATFPCNIITSVGQEATQTIGHFHVHVVPRRRHDGLQLPWGGG